MGTTTTLPLTFTILFFFFITLSSARISLPLRFPRNYVIHVSNPHPDSNSDQTILLPSQNLESLKSDTAPFKPATFLPGQKIVSSNPTPPLSGQRPDKSNPATIPSQKLDSFAPTTILLPGEKAKPTNIFPSQKPVSTNPTNVFPGQKPELFEPTTIPQERKQKPTIIPNQELETSDIFTILSGQKPELSDAIIPSRKLDLAEPATILPPGQKAESADPANVLELELKPETTTKSQPQTSNNEPKKIEKEVPLLSDTISIETLHLNPSTYIRIRPINRHFRVHPSLFRIHRCHHHHHIMNKRNEDPNSDDMIMAGRTMERFEPSIYRGSVRSTPLKWDRIHHYKHIEDGSMMKKHAFKHHMFAKLKRKAEKENQGTKDQEERKKGGFMIKFRKFLNHI